MPNIATVLKEEIARIARREVRSKTESSKKASAHYRTDIAALKRRVAALERLVTRLGKAKTSSALPAADDEGARKHRFSAKRLAAQRRRLGLSAAGVAQLLGVSAQSIYKWEAGKARPRASQIAAIATLRGMTRKGAAARLQEK